MGVVIAVRVRVYPRTCGVVLPTNACWVVRLSLLVQDRS